MIKEQRLPASTAVAEMFGSDLASQKLGIEITDSALGFAEARMVVTDAMVNGHGITHGGYVFLLADTAFACACNSHGPVTVASGAEINFVAPSHEGDVLVATALERTTYGRNGIYDVTVERVDTGGRTTIAEFRGRSRTLSSLPEGA